METTNHSKSVPTATEEDENLVQCDGVGSILHIDDENRKFYSAFQTCDLTVKLGDCVRVLMESGAGDTCNTYSFAQVLAIYEDAKEEINVEVRWFLQPHELSKQRKSLINPVDNELVETDQLDDIPAGSVCEVISIKGSGSLESITSDSFLVRYLETEQSKAIQKISVKSILRRGLEMSEYREAYSTYMESLETNLLTDDYSIAAQRLQISVIPDQLPCREAELQIIDNYIRDSLLSSNGTRTPLYICGMPGTGKTATVISCISSLRKSVEAGSLPEFDFVEINCLRLKSPADAYTQLWRGLTGYHLSAKAAQQRLKNHFNNQPQIRVKTNSSGNGTVEPVLVCLMDELDFLLTRDFRIIYNLFDWSIQPNSGLLLIGIANTMDLPERISARVESRTSITINRLIFAPYTHVQVQQILEKRLAELKLQSFESRAIEFIARKAATTVSDLRAALKICQTTIEMFRDYLVETNNLPTPGNNSEGSDRQQSATAQATARKEFSSSQIFNFVKIAVDKYKQTPFISVISTLCDLDKAILIVFCKHRRIVCGGDEHSSVAGMTAIMAWEKFQDFMTKVKADEYYGSKAVAVAVDAPVAASKSIPNNNGIRKVISLVTPPYHIFEHGLERLKDNGLFSTTVSTRSSGRSIVVYHVNSGLQYSDLLAALVDDAWYRFLSS